jgi:sugar/nucleoside kinase (ribokinase family)
MKRLGFLGAMNRDLVAQTPCAPILKALGVTAPPLLETAVSNMVAQRGAEHLLALGASEYLGGSAFNAARIAALLNDEDAVDLTFFGIAGTIGRAVPHRDALDSWAVDTSGVVISPIAPATCLAMVEARGRTLLTASGANSAVADWLRRDMAGLAASIARCDIVHVTSYLDPEAPALIARLLERAHEHNPQLIVSLDPGMGWVGPGGIALRQLLAQTDILHLNSEELALLRRGADPASIGNAMRPGWLIVARTHDGVTLHSAAEPSERKLPSSPVPADFGVTDATGAGDTFCGAFLWSYCRDAAQPLKAAALGFSLARHKVSMAGPLVLTDAVRRDIAAHKLEKSW